MKKTILLLTSTALSSIVLLATLFHFTTLPNEGKNGFNRRYAANSVQQLYSLNIKSPLERICGATAHNFFFSVRNPQWLVMIDKKLKDQDTIFFPVTINEKVKNGHFYFVDSPWIYLHVNNIPAVFYGNLAGGKINSVNLNSTLFTKSIQISRASLVIRAFDSISQKEQLFLKINTQTGKVLKKNPVIPEQNNDSGFSTDGLLQYDSLTNRLLYVQFYRNRFFCLDTNLNLLYTGQTIDTVKYNSTSIKLLKVDEKNKIMPGTSRQVINEQCFASNGRLYIKSTLKADNEKKPQFTNNDVIDIYRIKNGEYLGSIYIPQKDRKKIKSFLVKDEYLIALYSEHIALFKLQLPF